MELSPDAAPFAAQITVVSGPRGAGKTTYCQAQVAAARAAGQRVSGLLTPARFAGGQKTGIFVQDLRSAETRLLASALPGELSGAQLGQWTFDDQALAWGNRCLAAAGAADLLVVDELGPLEFYRQEGWQAAFDRLRAGQFQRALVIIRPECVADFRALGFSFSLKEV